MPHEPELRDYLTVLFRHKKMIGLFFIFSVIASIIAAYTLPKTYESQALVRIGKTAAPVFGKEEAVELLYSEQILRPVLDKLNAPFIQSGKRPMALRDIRKKNILAVENIKETPFLKASFFSRDPKAAQNYLDEVLSRFLQYGNETLQKKTDFIKSEISTLEKESDSIQRESAAIEAQIAKLSTPNETLTKMLIEKQRQLTRNKNKIIDLSGSIILENESFEIVTHPDQPSYPSKPVKRRIVLLSAIIGLMAGILAAFFAEYWKKTSARRETSYLDERDEIKV